MSTSLTIERTKCLALKRKCQENQVHMWPSQVFFFKTEKGKFTSEKFIENQYFCLYIETYCSIDSYTIDYFSASVENRFGNVE